MKNIFKKFENNEDGVLIVEATYVFPIVILVVFLMIYVGNAYLQKCKVEAIVTQEIVKGAAYCGDPVTESIESGEGIPSYGSIDIKPYRFLLGGLDEKDGLVDKIEENIKSKIIGMAGGLFKNMEVEDVEVSVSFNNALLYSTLSADVTYQITLPIRMLGQEQPTIMKFEERVDIPVSDSVELIRNIDMIEDYLQRWQAYKNAVEQFGEIVEPIKEKLGI